MVTNQQNIMEDNHSLASQEKVLVEKDGQFELVSTADVQAEAIKSDPVSCSVEDAMASNHLPTSSADSNQSPPVASVPSSELEKADTDTAVVSNDQTHKEVNELTDETLLMKTEQQQKETVPTSSNDDHENQRETETTLSNVEHQKETSSKIIVEDSLSKVDEKEKEPTSPKIDEQQKETKATSSKPKEMRRKTVSAPTVQHQKSEDRIKERELLNEKAFQRWIERKNAELLAQREAERKKMVSKESMETKLERNRKAFESWLRNKQRLLSAQSIKESDREKEKEERRKQNEDSFRVWLNKKSKQRAMSAKIENVKQNEINELAKKTEPNIAEKAYKE